MGFQRIAGVFLSLAIPAVLAAQGYLSGPALNKKIVSDFYRLVFEPRNPDLVEQYVAPEFVEHNPVIQGGREGLIQFLKTLPRPDSDEIVPEMKNAPSYITAEGDLVTFIFKRQMTAPKDKTETYDAFTFDMFRIKNGKISSIGTELQGRAVELKVALEDTYRLVPIPSFTLAS